MTTDILTRLAALTATDENGCLPCPFCAKPPDVDRYDSRIMGTNFQVECANPHCPVETGTCAHQSRDDAINHWNSRHADPSVIALVQEAVGEIERIREAAQSVIDTFKIGEGIVKDGVPQYVAHAIAKTALHQLNQALNPKETANV